MSKEPSTKLTLDHKIGSGGMGEVWQGHIEAPGGFRKRVAVKRITTGGNSSLQKEAAILSTLNHPNIVQIFDVRAEETDLLIVMEYLEGIDLSSLTKKLARSNSPLPTDLVENLLNQAYAALSYLHQKGIVHRDISPSNFFITSHGQLKLIDFGLAKDLLDSSTKSSGLIGTLQYISPERLRGEGVSAATDLFSLGVVFFELCTLQSLFMESDPALTIKLITDDSNPNISDHLRLNLPTLERKINSLLIKDPKKRFESASYLNFSNTSMSLDQLSIDLIFQAKESSQNEKTRDIRPAASKSRTRRRTTQAISAILLGTVVLVLSAAYAPWKKDQLAIPPIDLIWHIDSQYYKLAPTQEDLRFTLVENLTPDSYCDHVYTRIHSNLELLWENKLIAAAATATKTMDPNQIIKTTFDVDLAIRNSKVQSLLDNCNQARKYRRLKDLHLQKLKIVKSIDKKAITAIDDIPNLLQNQMPYHSDTPDWLPLLTHRKDKMSIDNYNRLQETVRSADVFDFAIQHGLVVAKIDPSRFPQTNFDCQEVGSVLAANSMTQSTQFNRDIKVIIVPKNIDISIGTVTATAMSFKGSLRSYTDQRIPEFCLTTIIGNQFSSTVFAPHQQDKSI